MNTLQPPEGYGPNPPDPHHCGVAQADLSEKPYGYSAAVSYYSTQTYYFWYTIFLTNASGEVLRQKSYYDD